MLLRLTPIIIMLALAGCDRVDAVSVKHEAREERVKRAQDLAAQPPQVTMHHLEHGDLSVIDVPTIAPGGFPDGQKCFLWRDQDFKTATLSCPADTGGDVPAND